MATVPHPVPSRLTHLTAELYGHADDTLLAWQRVCAQAAEALRPPPDPERLTKALALAQGGHVALADDGYALVTSGAKRYQVQADGVCDCPDAQHRGTPCKHVLAVLIHARAQELVAPSPRPVQAAAATEPPAAPPKPTRPPKPRHSAAWDVHEAPASACFKFRVGNMELLYTLRGVDDTELQQRMTATLPTLQEIMEACEERAAQRVADRAAAQAAQAPQAPAATVPQADLQALLQQAVQQALAAQATANGAAPSTAPPAAPAPDDQQTGFCSLHQVQMEQKHNERGTFYGHWLADEKRHCNGRRNGRR